MVLGILTAVAACPAIIGTTEAVKQGQNKNAKERHRGRKTNLIASCTSISRRRVEVNGGTVILRDHRLYIQAPEMDDELDEYDDKPKLTGHPFAGYFLPYPDHAWGRKGEGLVSTISNDPPQLNWIYVDVDTYQVKYGNRKESEDHHVGPWDCTKIDKRLVFECWEGFMAVEEEKGCWGLYFDRNDDGLKGKADGKRKLEIELIRKEMRKGKDDE